MKNQATRKARAIHYQNSHAIPLNRPDDCMNGLSQSNFRCIAIGVRSVSRKVQGLNLVGPFGHMKPWRVLLRGG